MAGMIPAGDQKAATEKIERLDHQAERRDRWLTALYAVMALVAVGSLVSWVFGGHLWAPAWVVIVLLLAVQCVITQRRIRLMRYRVRLVRQETEKLREHLDALNALHSRYDALIEHVTRNN